MYHTLLLLMVNQIHYFINLRILSFRGQSWSSICEISKLLSQSKFSILLILYSLFIFTINHQFFNCYRASYKQLDCKHEAARSYGTAARYYKKTKKNSKGPCLVQNIEAKLFIRFQFYWKKKRCIHLLQMQYHVQSRLHTYFWTLGLG